MGLFDADPSERDAPRDVPLAERMRPRTLDEFIGQEGVVGPGTALRAAIEGDSLRSIILWGPPGCGKTTLARIIAGQTRARFVPFSAVLSGIKEVRQVMQEASRLHDAGGKRTSLFVDEIHRFNRAQQDAFLPFVEAGTITLIGATTENPSFEVNSALLSRSRVYRMERLPDSALATLLERALTDTERGLGQLSIRFPEELLYKVAAQSQGDARSALNVLEILGSAAEKDDAPFEVTEARLEDALQKTALYYDRAGEEHFNLISALQKSMRNSDPDASLYWLARMLGAGEDPLYVARRIVRFASEDVGLADPQALIIAQAAKEAVHFVGIPEGELALAEATVYCALAPKSNALTKAWGKVKGAIEEGATEPVPDALRNAVTGLMKRQGYGRGYLYAHDHEDALTDLQCLPEKLRGRRFYEPSPRGFEKRLAERMENSRTSRKRVSRKPPTPRH